MSPATDDRLREEVRLLGSLLGDVIRDEGGPALFDRIEAVRQASVAYHRDPEAHDTGPLEALLAELSLDQAVGLAHGFATFSLLANVAEDRAGKRHARALSAERAPTRPRAHWRAWPRSTARPRTPAPCWPGP